MDELKDLIGNIEQKVQKLIARADRLETENRMLAGRLQEFETNLDLQKKKNKELENKNSILKVSGSICRNEDKQERQKAKAVIDGLIKEIDQCLMLLDN